MRKHDLLFATFIAIVLVSAQAEAGYWFQTGAKAGSSSTFNQGASVQIKTVQQEALINGTFAFWVGENLPNGAFLQAGYLIENQTGNYPTQCNLTSGCNGYQPITAGSAEWFYEYFPAGFNGGFLGKIGPDGSAGVNNTYNTYGFYSNGNTWYFTFDNVIEGSVNLGVSSSGYDVPVAFAELANTTSNLYRMNPVTFSNLSMYKVGVLYPAPTGFSYIGYGVGSLQYLRNPYGVEEVSNRVNSFMVGSGMQQPSNNTQLWSQGYILTITSQYGNISAKDEYLSLSEINLSAPASVYLNNNTRMAFKGWEGSGSGSYSGSSRNSKVLMSSNITETAVWQLQYFANVTSEYGSTSGSGWYDANQIINYSVISNTIYTGPGEREVFSGWSTGVSGIDGVGNVTSPLHISALWKREYYLNLTSTTRLSEPTGSGWYDAGSEAEINVSRAFFYNTTSARLSFYKWSNNETSPNATIIMTAPTTLVAQFREEYLIQFYGEDQKGQSVAVDSFYIDGVKIGRSAFLFVNHTYLLTDASYNGYLLPLNEQFTINSSGVHYVVLPLSEVMILTNDIFGIPLNTSASITFPNNTKITEYTGSKGELIFNDVPFGSVTGNVTYLGITQDIHTSFGSARIFFVSLLNILAFAAVLIIAVFMYHIHHHHIIKAPKQKR
jgi:hypothetical protein